jgi:hypothetical protein
MRSRTKRSTRARLALVAVCGAIGVVTLGVAPAFAHEGGHAGGCADFGINGNVPQQGPLVASFATEGPGVVADIVENVDHANCAS